MRQQISGYSAVFAEMKARAEGAMRQLEPPQLEWSPGPESNSIAVIVRHLSGNMRSRWTNFLEEDGEKPWRNRDAEFEEASGADTLEQWEAGWAVLFEALGSLQDADLEKGVRVRGNTLTVFQAIVRQIDHYAGHVGQIVYLAKWLRGPQWQTLSIERGASKAYRPRSSFLEGDPSGG